MHVLLSSRGALDAPSSGSTAAFAVQNMHKEHSSALELAKARVSDTLQVFRQRGVLSHHDYAADVPASLHGAPRTAEVIMTVASQGLRDTMPSALLTDRCFIVKSPLYHALQESKDVLERLRRMNNFESQDFDAVVRHCFVHSTLSKVETVCWPMNGEFNALAAVQDNDVEQETRLNKDHLDYVVEETWAWALACEPRHSHSDAIVLIQTTSAHYAPFVLPCSLHRAVHGVCGLLRGRDPGDAQQLEVRGGSGRRQGQGRLLAALPHPAGLLHGLLRPLWRHRVVPCAHGRRQRHPGDQILPERRAHQRWHTAVPDVVAVTARSLKAC